MQHRDVWLPVMRTTGLVTTETWNDLLIYDEEAKVLHNLNVMSREVWQSCDGSRTVVGIVACTGLDRDAVEAALEQLGDAGLLESPAESRHPSSQSRRRLLRKAGIASIPAIVSVTIPMAKAAASLCPDDCSGYPPGTPCSYSACESYSCQYFYNSTLTCIQNGAGQLTPS